MNTNSGVREALFPNAATTAGQENQHAYFVTGRGFSIGILYALEPFNDDGTKRIHIRVSYYKDGHPAKVTGAVLRVAERVIIQQSLRWPQRFDSSAFDAGPFAGLGVHVWETRRE